MKKNIGSLLALYPLPVTVIGAMNGANPTWTLVAHVGIIGHDKVLVSLAKPHFINSIIKETKKLTINLVQQDMLPETILLYNSGAFLSCEGSDNLEDLKTLEAQGVEILTCGTCLNHYGLAEKRQVGGVTNMYEIVEKMTKASVVVRP